MEINGKDTAIRDNKGKFLEGHKGLSPGRPKETEELKLAKKVKREFIAEYKEKLEEALPLISPVLIAKAMEGDMTAIKEVNDRAMGKAHQSVGVEGNIGLAINFASDFDKDANTPQ